MYTPSDNINSLYPHLCRACAAEAGPCGWGAPAPWLPVPPKRRAARPACAGHSGVDDQSCMAWLLPAAHHMVFLEKCTSATYRATAKGHRFLISTTSSLPRPSERPLGSGTQRPPPSWGHHSLLAGCHTSASGEAPTMRPGAAPLSSGWLARKCSPVCAAGKWEHGADQTLRH